MNSNILNTNQINSILKNNHITFNGCYSKDRLPMLQNGWYVVNMQNSRAGNGTHWVCMNVCGNNIFYIDSFGCIYPNEIRNIAGNRNIYFNHKQIQSLDSTACGYFCIYFISCSSFYNIKIMNRALCQFSSNPDNNDMILKKLLSHTIRLNV